MVTSFTTNIKIRTAIAPGIRDMINTPLMSMNWSSANAATGPTMAPA